jgi:MoaA/NifB/PqqE/SkfB family radical SAM enzyme
MVSLDGVGSVHDEQRGRKGNFDSAIYVIKHFQENTDIPVLVGCTITKINVWHVDELLEFCQENDIYIRFRIAEFINRLYNRNQAEVIRNFSEEEVYHLALFFHKLENCYENNEKIKRTYKNIRKMLLGESSRMIGCPYQYKAVVLDCRGNLQYCAPKSKIIGNTLETRASDIWRKNLRERRRIINEDCSSCIHDYHSEITTKELINKYKITLIRELLQFRTATYIDSFLKINKK